MSEPMYSASFAGLVKGLMLELNYDEAKAQAIAARMARAKAEGVMVPRDATANDLAMAEFLHP